ncbi:hypothetical protein RclHR1_01990010 [Rhizophagus clarus]|uniref:G-protein coupled receptors family 1 profile domain-containing protein n=1 Tax=Rhizophagus clarus TaxID=94130 RepID=A0A2Z6RIC6_9GLOM|nr:hypothetical protein RclHR1_01990010 [Rhizophagus clarus]
MEFNKINHSFHSLKFLKFTSYCEWQYDLDSCDDAETFKILLLVASIINFIVSLTALISLYWKLKNRPSSPNNKLWKIHEWSSIDLILLWIIIYCLFRGLNTFITALDLLSDNVILRASFYEISFIPGIFVVLIYLSNIFRLIPKLSFDQTSNHDSNIKTICIPKDKQLTIIFWSLYIYTILSLFCLAIVKGYSINSTKRIFSIITILLNVIFALIRLFIGFCFIYYGRISVNLTSQSMKLAGIDDNDDSNHSDTLNKLHVHKMQIFNIVCGITFVIYSLITIVSLIFFKNLTNNHYFGIFYFFSLVFGTPLFTLILVIAIILPVLTFKKSPTFSDKGLIAEKFSRTSSIL